jgi:ketosteroid isomerase-like protein
LAMSQENVETVRRVLEAWNTDDLDAFLAELDPEVEWHPSIEPALEGDETPHMGLDGARKSGTTIAAGHGNVSLHRFRRFATLARWSWSSVI